jgi:SpoVK/Ycf46/Vps4 family AAA+-type ATPase
MALRRFLSRRLGLTFLSLRESWSTGLQGEDITLDIERPTPAEQLTAWQIALAERAGEAPGRLAGQFNLNLPAIREIARKAQANSPAEPPELEARLWNACLLRTRPRLEQLAQRLEAKARWNDLVLPEMETSLLYQIAGQVGRRMQVYDQWGFREKMTRGLGISVLFAGESGTGKTMATEVLANDLQLDLYRIDLSAVVSKYIGETEKNLRRLFDAAEGGGALLLFDEADALFGKRSEVKDSHDRYANIEINYLLQRMEAYEGLAILATNMKSALDQAFLRRLRFIVNFTFPGPKERLRIWQGVFPLGVPFEDEDPAGMVDYDWLSRFNLTGGSIHNAALNAAFMAAADGGKVTMPLLLQAVRVEFRKMDKPVNEADFRWTPRVRLAEIT